MLKGFEAFQERALWALIGLIATGIMGLCGIVWAQLDRLNVNVADLHGSVLVVVQRVENHETRIENQDRRNNDIETRLRSLESNRR